ncbi:tetratricopeptide repeat protein [Aequorivita viscosa]|nr:tetratricopeptide repeat protein [Aequorivita viscosa]
MKKRNILLITILLFGVAAISQNDASKLQQTWVKVDVNMKDGSRHIPYYPWTNRYFEFTFFDNQYAFSIYPAETEKTTIYNYTLFKNSIYVSQHFQYTIEKLTADSLIIVENMADITDDKLKRYFLVSKRKLVSDYKKQIDTLSKIDARPYYSPIFEGNLKRHLKKRLKNTLGTTEFSGVLKLYPKTSKVQVQILNNEGSESTIFKRTIKAIEKSSSNWNFDGFEKFELVSIPFFISVENEGRSRFARIKLFATDKMDLLADYGTTLDIVNKSSDSFSKGLLAYNSGNFEQAIIYFSNSYKINPSFLDPLYNRAYTYYEMGDLENACSDWLELKNLGQTEGSALYLQYCD